MEKDNVMRTDDVRVSVSPWDNGGTWMYMSTENSSLRAVLTREQTECLIALLQASIEEEAAA